MRASLLLWGVALGWTAVPAHADLQTYCEAYARDQAGARLSGSAILGEQSRLAAAERETRKKLALADCLALYTPMVKIEPVTAMPETVKADPMEAAPEKPPARAKPKTVASAKQRPSGMPKLKPKTVTAKAADDPWESFDNPLTVSR